MASWCNDDQFPTQESFRDDNDEWSSVVFSNGFTIALGSRRVTTNTSSTIRLFDNARSYIGILGSTLRYVQAWQVPVQCLGNNLKYPNFQSIEERVSSFEKWPVQIIQTPRELAEAGLFFTGFDDCVCCFACGGKLRRWCINDDPWTEHCRLFPLCPFAQKKKGDVFIDQTQAACLDLENDDNIAMEEQLIVRSDMEELRGAFLEMGNEDSVFRKAIWHLRNLGIAYPTVDELADVVALWKNNRELLSEREDYESTLQENRRLRSIVFCILCAENNVDILFLPCAHNRLCRTCAEVLTQCPACRRNIEEKIPTSLTRRII